MAEKTVGVEKAVTVSAMDARKEELKKKLSYQRDKDREMVKGIFKFYEVEGGSLSFSFGPMYKGDETQNFTLYDGQVCTIPLGVAKHLNKNGWYPIHAFQQDDYGKPIMRIGQKVRRFGFNSLEFVDIDDLTPVGNSLLTVEKVVPTSNAYLLDQYNKG